jgi:hypothetical protein
MTWLASRDRSKVTDADWTSNGTEKVYTGLTRTKARTLWSSAKSKDTVAYALYGVGGAAVVTGVVLWLTSGSDRVTPTAVPIPGGAVVNAGGSF